MGGHYVPTGRPGHRLPHQWLERDGDLVSTLDLVRPGRFLLLTGAAGGTWCAPASAAAERHGVALACVVVGPDGTHHDPDGTFGALTGIDEGGALLVRPDGHVAWRARTALTDAAAEVSGALDQILRGVAIPRSTAST